MYLLFLVVFALPILVMEFAVGRASQKGVARSFDELEPAGAKWHRFKWAALRGQLPAHDVLHHGGRLDDLAFMAVQRRGHVRGPGRAAASKGVFNDDAGRPGA